jgi:hypothetical protein
VREDPKRKGLLFAGTERAAYVSFDDGDHWQSLRLNMPATSVRDLTIKDDDLAVATHGRGFWIIDDITPLRQLDDKLLQENAAMLKPETAYRVRWDTNSDTPLPPDEPAGENPPDGAILDYYLKSVSSTPVTLEILDDKGQMVRKFASDDPVPPPDPQFAIPAYWLRPLQQLSNQAGLHRFVWDLHYTPTPGVKPEYPIAAVSHNTAPAPTSPWVMPGTYSVVLTVDGRKYTQPLTVVMDPRVKTSTADLQRQFELSQQVYSDLQALRALNDKVEAAKAQLKTRHNATLEDAAKVAEVLKALEMLQGAETGRRRRGPRMENIGGVRGTLLGTLGTLQEADAAPSQPVVDSVTKARQSMANVQAGWEAIANQKLAPLNPAQ